MTPYHFYGEKKRREGGDSQEVTARGNYEGVKKRIHERKYATSTQTPPTEGKGHAKPLSRKKKTGQKRSVKTRKNE